MPTWTKEQNDAIYKSGSNIIVSAGAGSGKTAVLSERVIEKLKSGIHIDELLILTFTKAAAAEMRERIRKKIKKVDFLKNELNLIDSAYITTFDSFAMATLKKYHYLLNVSNSLDIVEDSVIALKKREIIDDIFDSYYLNNDSRFVKLINDFCIKDDKDLKDSILKINNKLDLKIDKIDYLTNYIKNNYNDIKITSDIKSYENLLVGKIDIIKSKIDELAIYSDSDYIDDVYTSLCNLLSSRMYDDIKANINISLPRLPKNSSDEVKNCKESLAKSIKELSDFCIYSSKVDIYNTIISTKDYISIICDILIKLHNAIMDYKHINDVYEFNDIAIMAIKILDNKEVSNEIKHHFKEILVDEYQDTSDLQEEFIKRIENNNVYMVGDIKQSIYRFRNANPYIFKNKYDNYAKNNGGIKIDLLKNFRSRNEVLDNINTIFNLIMDDEVGGADYINDHQMVFGNNTYINEGKTSQNNNFEVYTYNYKDINFSKEEIEIFIILNDIKNKINNKYQVFDKDNLVLRDIRYDDFVILLDRSSSFDLYKKVFEYMNVPLAILKDDKLNTDVDIMILNNLINFVIKVKKNEIDTEFKYLFTSITRSFIYNYSDNEIFNYFINNNYIDSDLYKKALDISKNIDILSIRKIIDLILNKFDFIYNIIKICDIDKVIIKLDKIKDISDNLNNMGYTIYTFSLYLKEILSEDYNMTFNMKEEDNNSVKIMTIHKSKGLEYHICYFPGLYKEFNFSDSKELFTYDNKYGIIVPYFDEGIGNTIYKALLKEKYKEEEISEKIRLFYVALTRAKEKMVMILPNNDKDLSINKTGIIDKNIRLGYKSFRDIFNSIECNIKSYYKYIDINTINLTKEYNYIKNKKIDVLKNDNKLLVNEIDVKSNIINNITFSKNINKILDKSIISNMEFGTKIHEILEIIDFKNIDLSFIDDKYIKDKISTFLSLNIFDNINEAKIYKEYEFIDVIDNNTYHGIIDLMLEYDDYINIIDYKLKDISDDNYLKQLSGYKVYIENKTKKKVYIYLYSIMNNQLKQII